MSYKGLSAETLGRIMEDERAKGRGEIIAALTHGDEFERLVEHVASAWGGTSATHLAQVKRILRHAADHFAEQSRLSAPVVALQAEKDASA